MFLQFIFTSFLVHSLYILSEGSMELNQSKAFRTIQCNQEFLKEQDLIKDDLTLLKSGQDTVKEMLKDLIEKVNVINNTNIERVTKQPPRVSVARSCAEAITPPRRSGIYEISIPFYYEQPFKVPCSAETRGGNWTIILRRMDGSVDFYRKWADYKEGFGNLNGEFFLGLEKIYAITNDQPQELLVILEDFKGEVRYEAYDAFAIGDELDWYKLHTLGKASGTAGDALNAHHGKFFTSQDRDHDTNGDNCAVMRTGGWWYFQNCVHSNLMGQYNNTVFDTGIVWQQWRGNYYSLKQAIMMIRSKTN